MLGTWEVAVRRCLWIEDYVGNLAGPPLVLKEGEEFLRGATGAEVSTLVARVWRLPDEPHVRNFLGVG